MAILCVTLCTSNNAHMDSGLSRVLHAIRFMVGDKVVVVGCNNLLQ